MVLVMVVLVISFSIPSMLFPLKVSADSTVNIGDSYGGGKVAYIFVPGDPGYVEGEINGLIGVLPASLYELNFKMC